MHFKKMILAVVWKTECTTRVKTGRAVMKLQYSSGKGNGDLDLGHSRRQGKYILKLYILRNFLQTTGVE